MDQRAFHDAARPWYGYPLLLQDTREGYPGVARDGLTKLYWAQGPCTYTRT